VASLTAGDDDARDRRDWRARPACATSCVGVLSHNALLALVVPNPVLRRIVRDLRRESASAAAADWPQVNISMRPARQARSRMRALRARHDQRGEGRADAWRFARCISPPTNGDADDIS
jgi:hypothetical protein